MKAQGRSSTTPIQAKRRPDATVEPRFVILAPILLSSQSKSHHDFQCKTCENRNFAAETTRANKEKKR